MKAHDYREAVSNDQKVERHTFFNVLIRIMWKSKHLRRLLTKAVRSGSRWRPLPLLVLIFFIFYFRLFFCSASTQRTWCHSVGSRWSLSWTAPTVKPSRCGHVHQIHGPNSSWFARQPTAVIFNLNIINKPGRPPSCKHSDACVLERICLILGKKMGTFWPNPRLRQAGFEQPDPGWRHRS